MVSHSDELCDFPIFSRRHANFDDRAYSATRYNKNALDQKNESSMEESIL